MFIYRSKRGGYDNIAVGSATGHENIVAVGSGGDEGETTLPGLDLNTGTSTSVLAIAHREMLVNDGVSDDVRTGQQTTLTSPAWTSDTTFTSAFPENVG